MNRRILVSALAISAIAFAPHAGKAATGDGAPVDLITPPAPPAPPAPVAGTVLDVSTDFELPAKSGRGGGPSPYKFAELAAPTVTPEGKRVLASFGVVGKTKKNLNSTVHTANKNERTMLFNSDGSPQMAVKKVKGRDVPYHAFSQNAEYEAFDVSEPNGVTVRVFRTK